MLRICCCLLAVLLAALAPMGALAGGALKDYLDPETGLLTISFDVYCADFADGPFRSWSVETQYAFMQEVQAYMEAGMEINPDPRIEFWLPSWLVPLWEHRYALPGEDDLTQEQARAAAMAYLCENAGEAQRTLDGYIYLYSFLADDSDAPQWSIMIYENDIYHGKNRRYQLVVPARGGEITLLYDYQNPPPLTAYDELDLFLRALPVEQDTWTLEQQAAYGDKLLELMDKYPGFNDDHFFRIYGRPAADELSYEDAISFAQETLEAEYGAQEGWNAADHPFWYAQLVRVGNGRDTKPAPCWQVNFKGGYTVYLSLDPAAPVVLDIDDPSEANG